MLFLQLLADYHPPPVPPDQLAWLLRWGKCPSKPPNPAETITVHAPHGTHGDRVTELFVVFAWTVCLAAYTSRWFVCGDNVDG